MSKCSFCQKDCICKSCVSFERCPPITDYNSAACEVQHCRFYKKKSEYFDVPLEQGRQEFENAHSTWLSSKYNRVFCYSANEDVTQKTWVFDSEDKILKSLYGRIDFDVFSEFELKFRQRLYKEAFSVLYGKLDFDTYYQIQASIADMQKTA